MSNTTVPISEWCKEIRVALARKEMNLQSVADEIGYSYTTITALISGRIVKDNYLDIAKKINEVLEVNVLPEKPQLPSDEWCGAVRAKHFWRIAMILAPSLKIWRISRTRIRGKARLSGRLLMRCWFTRQQSTSAILFLIIALEMQWFHSSSKERNGKRKKQYQLSLRKG